MSKVTLEPVVMDETCVPALPVGSEKLIVKGIVPDVSPLCITAEADQDMLLPCIEAE